jgi:hypothetical protein
MGGGYNIYTHESRFYVPCRRHGLVQPQDPVVASILISHNASAIHIDLIGLPQIDHAADSMP